MFNKKRALVVAVSCALLSGGVFAETPAEQIRTINEQIAVLSAQLSELEFRAKIAAKQEEIRKLNSPPVVLTPSANQNQFGQDDLPIVRSIDGVDGKLKATLFLRNGGGLQTLGEGDKFGAWTIKNVSVNAVTISKGKEVTRLVFGTDPASSAASSIQTTNVRAAYPGNSQGLPALPGAPGFSQGQ